MVRSHAPLQNPRGLLGDSRNFVRRSFAAVPRRLSFNGSFQRGGASHRPPLRSGLPLKRPFVVTSIGDRRQVLGERGGGLRHPLLLGRGRRPKGSGKGLRVRAKPAPEPEPTLASEPLRCGGVSGPVAKMQGGGWDLILDDSYRRSFVSCHKGAFRAAMLDKWWELLYDKIAWEQPLVGQRRLPRSAAWLTQGECRCSYQYSGTSWSSQRMDPWFLEITDAICRACGIKERPNSCNANFYEDGNQMVGWHSDDEPLFNATQQDSLILSLSLGVSRSFELRPDDAPSELTKVCLESGDILTMEGLCQKHYRHRVPPETRIKEPRINLTWRWIVAHEANCPLYSSATAAALARRKRKFDALKPVGAGVHPQSQQISAEETARREKRSKRFAGAAPIESILIDDDADGPQGLHSSQKEIDEKIQKRADRFQAPAHVDLDEQKKRRAERFGVGQTKPLPMLRALVADAESLSAGASSDEMKRKRAERFGVACSPAGGESSMQIPEPAQRSGLGSEGILAGEFSAQRKKLGEADEQKRKRAERFGLAVDVPSRSSEVLASSHISTLPICSKPPVPASSRQSAGSAAADERRRMREQRFAAETTDKMVAPAKLSSAEADAQRLKQRAERFATSALLSASGVGNDIKPAAKISAADLDKMPEEQKRELRAKRFAGSDANVSKLAEPV